MYEVKNRIHFDGDGKVVAFDDPTAVTSIPPGRITDADAAALGLTDAPGDAPVPVPDAEVEEADEADDPEDDPETAEEPAESEED